MRARYLLRFDDLCPTMDRARWERFERLILLYGLKPILAVVPDNHDPELMLDAPDPDFWGRMRRLEDAGAVLGLHGLTHVCEARGKSLIPLHPRTEFAGVAAETQRAWIRTGLEILRGHGLNPRIWVAPRHGFDRVTLEALRGHGLSLVSDGFAAWPFRSGGVIWIPQQLWGPALRGDGVWTICLHANTASDADVIRLEEFLKRNAGDFTSVGDVICGGVTRTPGFGDLLFHHRMLTRIAISRWRKRLMTAWGRSG